MQRAFVGFRGRECKRIGSWGGRCVTCGAVREFGEVVAAILVGRVVGSLPRRVGTV